jgi:hypothetical protein
MRVLIVEIKKKYRSKYLVLNLLIFGESLINNKSELYPKPDSGSLYDYQILLKA